MSMTFSLAMLGFLMVAAWRDLATRTIPNTICLLLVATGVSRRVLEGPEALALSAGAGLALFFLLMVAYSRGLVGGGDVKIISAFAVGFSPFDSCRFIIATALAGGLLGIVYLLLSFTRENPFRARRKSLLGRVAAVEAWRIRRRGPLPYAVAIAAGGAFVLLDSGSF